MVENPHMDSRRSYYELTCDAPEMSLWFRQNDLTDVMRERLPSTRWYTRWTDTAANRLDRLYVSEGLRQESTPGIQRFNPCSDHLMPTLWVGERHRELNAPTQCSINTLWRGRNSRRPGQVTW